MDGTDLSIIVLNYNTRELLKNCLKSVADGIRSLTEVPKIEVIVVDNGSTDGTINELKKLQAPSSNMALIESKKNLGFAAGNNLGIRKAQGKYILLLNSDTVIEHNTLSEMFSFMEKNPDVGVATCRVELSNGKIDPACHRGFPTPWASLTYFMGLEKLFPKTRLFGQYHLGFLPMDKPHEIDSPTGAFYLIRKKVIDKVGLLDEDYFMYGEDLDWSFRIKQAGWKIMYYPYVKITHFKKQSGRAKDKGELREETDKYFYETMKTFYQKHYANKYPPIINSLIMMAIEARKRLKFFF